MKTAFVKNTEWNAKKAYFSEFYGGKGEHWDPLLKLAELFILENLTQVMQDQTVRAAVLHK